MCLKFSKEPSSCTHNLKYLPEWKSSEKLDIVKLILKDNQTILKRESMGFVGDESVSAIEDRYLESFFETPRQKFSPDVVKPSFYVVGNDPSTSDSVNSSEMTFFAACHMGGKHVVCIIPFLVLAVDQEPQRSGNT